MCIFSMVKKNADGIRSKKNWFIRQQGINFWILITKILMALLQMRKKLCVLRKGCRLWQIINASL